MTNRTIELAEQIEHSLERGAEPYLEGDDWMVVVLALRSHRPPPDGDGNQPHSGKEG